MRLPDKVQEFFERSGKRGGKVRAEKLPAKRRKEIARNAALARWSKKKEKGPK